MAKCRICKKIIKPLDDDFMIISKATYYHTECYKVRELEKLVPIEVVNDIINNAKEEYQNKQNNKVKTYKNKSVQEGLDPLVKWIQSEYDITVLPKSFYIKMATVANGTYKGLKEPIIYHEILDMLQRKKRKLDLQLTNKKFDNNLYRFYYDLAVVLNQYDSYKQWKIVQENNKTEAINNTKLHKRVEDTQKITKTNKTNKQESIENILDDIFD